MSTDAVVVDQPALSQGERVMNMFTAPSKTFEDIHRSRSWWLPFLLIAVFGLAFGTTVIQKVGTQQLAQQAMEKRAEKTGQQMDPAQATKAMAITEMIFKSTLLGWPVFHLVWTAAVALLLFLGMNFILGGTSKYSALFCMAMYAAVPGLIKSVLAILTMLVSNNDNFTLENPVGTNIGYFMSSDGSRFLHAFLSSLDIFTLWYVILLGLGGAILARVKSKNGVILVVSVWLVVVLIKAALA